MISPNIYPYIFENQSQSQKIPVFCEWGKSNPTVISDNKFKPGTAGQIDLRGRHFASKWKQI